MGGLRRAGEDRGLSLVPGLHHDCRGAFLCPGAPLAYLTARLSTRYPADGRCRTFAIWHRTPCRQQRRECPSHGHCYERSSAGRPRHAGGNRGLRPDTCAGVVALTIPFTMDAGESMYRPGWSRRALSGGTCSHEEHGGTRWCIRYWRTNTPQIWHQRCSELGGGRAILVVAAASVRAGRLRTLPGSPREAVRPGRVFSRRPVTPMMGLSNHLGGVADGRRAGVYGSSACSAASGLG